MGWTDRRGSGPRLSGRRYDRATRAGGFREGRYNRKSGASE